MHRLKIASRTHSNIVRLLLAAAFSLAFVNCGPKPKINPQYQQMKPTVIVVLPPENTTSNTEVEETAYPIIFEKITNRGYYCISPEMVRATFNANRMEDAGRINALPPQKFKEVFNADAVLKTKITDWSSKYILISASVTITLEMQLVDAKTGEELWSMTNTVSKSPNNSGGGVLGALVSAAMTAAFTAYEPIMEENANVTLTTVPLGDYNKKK
jgi:hypothetical protein